MSFIRAKLCAYNTALPFILFLLLFSHAAIADWNSGATIEDISTRIAINIIEEGVKVTLTLKENSLAQSEHKDFALQVIKIQHNQQSLKPGITKTNKDVFEIAFPFTERLPVQLEIIPDFELIKQAGKNHMITVAHQGLPVIDHGILTSAETLKLDWLDPWYSHFLNPKLKRDHNDPVMAFLYIEPQTIKSEIVVRVKELAAWTDLGLRDDKMIYPDEFEAIKQKAGQFLLAKNKVSADTQALTSTLDRVDYIRMGAADIQSYQPQQAQRQVATLIGISLIQHTQKLAEKVQWHWHLFNPKIQRVAIRAYDPAGLFDSYVTPAYPVFEWENMLADIDLPELNKQPKSTPVSIENNQNSILYYSLWGTLAFLVICFFASKQLNSKLRIYVQISIILCTLATSVYSWKTGNLKFISNTPDLDSQQARPVLNQLLWNIYQAFESSNEAAAYDQLANSVSGTLQETLYLQNRKSFLLQDGAWSKVSSIEIQTLTGLSSNFNEGLFFDCEWLVVGDVIHWGHQHRRENLYRAKIKISAINKNWKITELESIGQQRVDG